MQNSHTKAVLLLDFVSKCIQTLQNTNGVIKNGQSWKKWQHRVHKLKKNKTKTQHNMCWTPLSTSKHNKH